ncbi:MAG: TonB-dependent receptor plug domain-containing protein, partial [Pyrinomonadaceae bacterium]|nr:TonB-dependent receptor plug domain-containing protein [Sphingobacteriaceae bacterium]
MKGKITLTFLILYLFCSSFVNGQELRVSGKVTQEDGQTLPGVNVKIKGSGAGTQTNANGAYSLTVPSPQSILVFSYLGFAPQEISADGRSTVNIVLKEDLTSLQEVVVIGYGTQKVTNVSGAISIIKSAEIEKQKPLRVEEALQGRASGVSVIQNGSPGSKPTVLIRGIPSFSGTDPVVIIDGVPQTLDDLNAVNSNDIETINVLKDAAATAIYGVKGGNGVIVVTTKTGKKNQKTEITVNTYFGQQEAANKIGLLNASEYAAMINEG